MIRQHQPDADASAVQTGRGIFFCPPCYHSPGRGAYEAVCVVAEPRPPGSSLAVGVLPRRRAMTTIQEIILSIAIAMCALAASKAVWAALAAVW